MRRIGYWLLTLMAISCGWVKGQTPEAALAAAEARFKALNSFSATVGYVMGSHRDVGKVYYQGNKYHLDFPEDQTICDGKVTMNWSKAFADISYPEPGEGPDLSVAGIYSVYRFPYTFEWIDSASTIQKMRLTPKNNDTNIPAMTIHLHRKTGFIDGYSVDIRQDFTMEMMVLDYKLDPVLNEKLFVIDWAFVKRVENGEVPAVEHEH
jgi:outer membrane lipoprotein-sorting protein